MDLTSFGIYQILNVFTGMSYIGSTGRCFSKRFFEHKIKLKKKLHNNSYLQRVWDKYGETAFEFRILEVLQDSSKLEEREQYWIEYYKSNNKEFGYNLRKDATSNLGTKYPNRKKGYVIVPRENRVCICGCKISFECKINSKQKFIQGHNSIGNKHSLGKESLMKGKTLEEIYGLEKASVILQKQRESHLGKPSARLGHLKERTEYVCETCGSKFYRLPNDSHNKTYRFCSQYCANVSLWKNNLGRKENPEVTKIRVIKRTETIKNRTSEQIKQFSDRMLVTRTVTITKKQKEKCAQIKTFTSKYFVETNSTPTVEIVSKNIPIPLGTIYYLAHKYGFSELGISYDLSKVHR